jgi:CheY-like chemotaxis protein
MWKGCKVAIYGLSAGAASPSKVESSRALARYITDWYSIEVVALEGSMAPDIVIVEERDVHLLLECHPGTGTEAQNALLVLCMNATRHSEAQADNSELPKESVVEFVSKPCGPYKLAKALLDCIRKLRASRSKSEVIAHCNGFSEEPSLQTNGAADHLKASNIGPSSHTNPATGRQTTDTAAAPQIAQHEQIAFMALPSVGHMNCGQTTSFPFPNTSRNSGASSSNDTPVSPTSGWADTQIQRLSDFSVASPDAIPDRLLLSPRVLLVDDNKINLSLLKAFMKKRKYKLVDYAEDGSIAVNAIKAAAEPYDIIFMGKSNLISHSCLLLSQLHELTSFFLHRYFNASHERLRSDQSYPSPRKQIFAAMGCHDNRADRTCKWSGPK